MTTTAIAAPPPDERPTDGSCSHWVGAELRYCRATDGVRFFVPGHRCPAHTPNALKGLPEVPAGPGWPIHRQEAQA